MNNMKNIFFGFFFVIFTQGCASIGTAIDGGKELVVRITPTPVHFIFGFFCFCSTMRPAPSRKSLTA